MNNRTLKLTDKDVWDLIMLQWNLYSNKAPQLGGGDKNIYKINIYKREVVVSLPDNVVDELKSEFGDKIITGPANGFGLYLCKEGLLKDGVKEIFWFIGGSTPYEKKMEEQI